MSIALSVVDSVAEYLGGRAGGGIGTSGEQDAAGAQIESIERVASVTLRVGALSGVDPAALRFAFPDAARNSPLAGAALVIEPVPAAAWCPSCGEERPLPSPPRFQCPVCAGPTPRLLRGRELEILSIEIVEGGGEPAPAA